MDAKKKTSTESNEYLLKRELKAELESLLSWWMFHMADLENGGFYGRMDGRGKRFPKANKSIILNTRILWTFAAAARLTKKPAYKKMADRAFRYISTCFLDSVEDGVFWMLDFRGNPIQTKKQIYAQAFAIYAFAEYYLLTKNKTALNHAKGLFQLIEKHSSDKKRGGYFEAFSSNWQGLEDLRLSEKDQNAAKTMNTHLHILEAYTMLFKAKSDRDTRVALERLIECFLEKFIDKQTGHLKLFFDENWNPKSDSISFGHDIECSWLLVEAAGVLGEKKLEERVVQTALKMADVTLREGLDRDGGLFNEASPGGIVDTDKHWWPQAEAVVGFWNAWQLSKEVKFQQAAMRSWVFIEDFLRDENHGEWHWRVNRHGKPILSEDKAGPWKAPYHNGRMCLEMVKRL